MTDFLSASKAIGEALTAIPRTWDGRKAILAMRDAGFPHWRQMEWIGFFFEFLCQRHLAAVVQMPGPKYGKVQFDGLKAVPWDFKAHAMNTSSHQVIFNDSLALANAIRDYESVGMILAIGEVDYNDEARTFQKWHQEIKGATSKYEKERIARGAWSRRRKVSFDLKQISFIRITDDTLVRCGSFQVDFRNADGRPRKAKVLIDLEQIERELEYYLDFE